MALTVESITELQTYFTGVVERADHHASNVSSIVYPLLGYIVLNLDSNTSIKVWGNTTGQGNIAWGMFNGNRITFRYDHENKVIELREGSHRGPILFSVDNSTTNHELKEIFNRITN